MPALHPSSWPARSAIAVMVLALAIPASPALAGEDDAAPPPPCGTVAAEEDCTVVPTPVPTVAPTPVPTVVASPEATPTPAPVTQVAPVRRTPERTVARKRAEQRPVTAPVAAKPRIVYVARTVGSTTRAQQSATPVGGVGAGGGGTAGSPDGGLLTGISGLGGLLLLLGGAARATQLRRRAV